MSRKTPKCECAAGFIVNPIYGMRKIDGVLTFDDCQAPSIIAGDKTWRFEMFVGRDENFYTAVKNDRKSYKIPRGAMEIAFEIP